MDDASLQIATREMLDLIGGSRRGKATLAKTELRLYRP